MLKKTRTERINLKNLKLRPRVIEDERLFDEIFVLKCRVRMVLHAESVKDAKTMLPDIKAMFAAIHDSYIAATDGKTHGLSCIFTMPHTVELEKSERFYAINVSFPVYSLCYNPGMDMCALKDALDAADASGIYPGGILSRILVETEQTADEKEIKEKEEYGAEMEERQMDAFAKTMKAYMHMPQ